MNIYKGRRDGPYEGGVLKNRKWGDVTPLNQEVNFKHFSSTLTNDV